MTTHRGRYGLPASGLPIRHKVTHATAPEIIRRYEARIQTRGRCFRLLPNLLTAPGRESPPSNLIGANGLAVGGRS